MLMATRPATLLWRLMLPPVLLCRLGAATPVFGSADETLTTELIPTVPLSEFRFTVPPAPPASLELFWRPVVASIGDPTVMSPVALTVNVPPLPDSIALLLLAPPLKVTAP